MRFAIAEAPDVQLAHRQARSRSVIDMTDLSQLEAPQLREMVHSLASNFVTRDREIAFKQALIAMHQC